MVAPDITFRDKTTPSSVLASIAYVQTKDGGTNLPVAAGENSDNIFIRVYNNWALNTGVANALNVHFTTYDAAGGGGHTAAKTPISAMWIHDLLNGYGEGTTTPGSFTSFVGTDTPVGGASNRYLPERGSDGSTTQITIRAGSDNNHLGFMELKTYASVPGGATPVSYTFVWTVEYEYST